MSKFIVHELQVPRWYYLIINWNFPSSQNGVSHSLYCSFSLLFLPWVAHHDQAGRMCVSWAAWVQTAAPRAGPERGWAWKGLWHRSAHLAMQTHAVLSFELRAIIFYLSYWISDIDIWLHPFLCHGSCRPRTWSSFQNSVLSANSVRLRFSSDFGMAKAGRVPSDSSIAGLHVSLSLWELVPADENNNVNWW